MSAPSLHNFNMTHFVSRFPQAFHDGDPEAARKATEADNVRRLQAVYHAIAHGDFAAVTASMTDDTELELVGPPEIPLVGRWQGREQVSEAVGRNFALLEEQQVELLSVVAQGDTVAFVAHERGRYRATGKPYAMHWVALFTFRNGQVARCRIIFDSASLLDAVRAG
jgi:ketosteroid isomerase-like protein